mgnify:CR=1 FL=1
MAFVHGLTRTREVQLINNCNMNIPENFLSSHALFKNTFPTVPLYNMLYPRRSKNDD